MRKKTSAGTTMAGKRKKRAKSSTRKKGPGAGSGKRLSNNASSTHHPYESKIVVAVNAMLRDVKGILAKLLNHYPYDSNSAPTAGIAGYISDLIDELTNGERDQKKHDDTIEGNLWAIAGIEDQYHINGHTPPTHPHQPSSPTHEERVVELFTTINSICREVLQMLEPGKPLPTQPKDIVDLAKDTQQIVALIKVQIKAFHVRPTISPFTK